MSRYDIAVIGMGCIFPGANNVDQYWKNIASGDTFFKKMPTHLWHLDNFYSPSRTVPEKTYTTTGAFIEGFEFPFLEYRLPPKVMQGVDPAQLVTLEATREALKDAGIEPRSQDLVDAVTIIGSSGVDQFAHSTTYLRRHTYLKKLMPLLEARGVSLEVLAALKEEMAEELWRRGHTWNPSVAAVGAITSSVSNRVAQVFGVKGFNMTVDAACASSFVAMDTACQALMAGDTRIAIAGGSDLGTNPAIYVGFSRVEGLSISGNSNPFDHTADGLIIGEGAGIVILKRLEDALADGDRIRTVIRGVGSTSDGSGQAIYAPSVEGRAQALRRALEISKTSANEVQFLEAHATSTIVGDANEYDAISTVYAPGRDPANPLRLGSVKQQIGHLKAAAGVAGFIKTVLGMENASLPHMPRFTALTPGAEHPSPALLIPTEVEHWPTHPNGKRVAAITSSGFGGVNYHFIIEHGDAYGRPDPRPPVQRDIAIVGMTCRVSGADTVDGFWENIKAGTNAFSEVDPKELGWEDHLDTGPETERITTRVISRLEKFETNLLRYKIFPNAVSQISPTQFLALDLSDRLLTEFGCDFAAPKRIGVSLGAMHDDDFPDLFMPLLPDEYADAVQCCDAAKKIDGQTLKTCLADVAETIQAEYPPVTEHTLPGWMTNVVAGRVANKLNLRGPNFTVDSACSSGLAAMLPAIYQLMFGDVDMMITGGLNQQLSDTFTCGVCALGAVAETIAKPYDADGKGFLIGEGGVFFLFKRLADAERDGDDIIAVLHAVHGSSEADSKSMVAPTEEAVRRSISNALERTSLNPNEVGVVDTHGSANPLSDLVEARAIAAELRADNGAPPVEITAIKSHIGHLYGGAGASSLFSAIQTLRTKTVPGIRNLKTPRPEIAELSGQVKPRFGTEPLAQGFRAGAANSLGLGGANYTAFVSLPTTPLAGDGPRQRKPAPERSTMPSDRPFVRSGDWGSDDIFVCIAQSEADFAAALGRALQQEPIPLVISEGEHPAARLAVTFQDQDELRNKLQSALKLLSSGHGVKPLESQGIFGAPAPADGRREKLAFCFPGQGTHYISMGRHLYDGNPVFKSVVDQVHDLAMKKFDFDLLGHIYGDPEDPDIAARLGTLVGAQTALFAVELGMAAVLKDLGVAPDVMIGHSFGEISALAVAGAWDTDVAFQVVAARIEAAEQIIKGGGPALGMMSVICSDSQRDAILKLVEGKVVLTNINAPGRFVMAGQLDAVKQTVAVAESFGAEARLLPIGAAFHSRFMEPAKAPFKEALSKLPCIRPSTPILSTITGYYIDPDGITSATLAAHLSEQLTTPLNLPREIGRLHSEGIQHYIEVGPGWSMTKMISAILEGQPYRAAPTLHPKVGDEETFRRARAFLMALGHLDSAAERQNLPGMFSPDFVAYLETSEPAVLALIREVHKRYLDTMQTRSAEVLVSQPVPDPAPDRSVVPIETSAAPDLPPDEPNAPERQDASVWRERVREKLVAITGYPAEMLEDQLDLEADLGVDSVQRAEIWLALTSEFNLDSETRPKAVRTIMQLADALAELSGPDETDAAAPATPDATPQPVAAPLAPTSPADASGAAVWIERVREKLVTITGYPPEMLEDQLDLEADLGVDSVQRAEIWLALTSEYNLDSETRPKGVRTIAQLAESLQALSNEVGDVDPAPLPLETAPASEVKDPDACQLFAPSTRPLSEVDFEPFSCKRVLLITRVKDDHNDALHRLLTERNIEVRAVDVTRFSTLTGQDIANSLEQCDTVIYTAHHQVNVMDARSIKNLRAVLDREVTDLYQVFRNLAEPLATQPRRIIVPVSQDGAFGAGAVEGDRFLGAFPAGFIRSVSRELEHCRFQLIDTGDTPWPEAIADHIDVVGRHLEIGLTRFGRVTPTLAPVVAFEDGLQVIGAGDLILVTGGARGIVFECVLALARKTGCRVLLTGRTEAPTGNPDWLSANPEELPDVIRKLEIDMVKNDGVPLKEAKRFGSTAKAQWELNRNLERLRTANVDVQYTVCDVTDPKAFGDLIKRVAKNDGIRGIVHGAGVQRSKLIGDLTDQAVGLTLGTKVSALITLLDALDWSQVKLFLGFGSITGLFGNAGQTDYALANDLLGWMIKGIGARHPHLFAQIVDWTAWVGTGMVTEEEAKRFSQAGLIPLDVETGVALFMDAVERTRLEKLAALNASAGFAAGRDIADHPVPATVRSQLLTDAAKARFSTQRDLYLDQHLVEMLPVVPGTFVSEIFAEATADSNKELCNIRFRRPLWIREDGFEVEVVTDNTEMLLLPAVRPDLKQKGRSNLAFASCHLGDPNTGASHLLDFQPEDLKTLGLAAKDATASFYSLLDGKFSHALKTGPIFRGVWSTVERKGQFFGAVRLTDAAMGALAVPGEFVFNPVLADMAVQVACAWAMITHNVMAIPNEIGQLHIENKTRVRDAIVICQKEQLSEDKTIVNVAVREPDHRLILTMDRLVLSTIAKGNA
ncbi:MAG: beta-ketoacyl synthase N-terminal-like domain-containing protein [Myxococcota bacterium]|nr:beta-ketoacyl synthase N-terminal-like domain-containing protein [Myxococcota bacterium]